MDVGQIAGEDAGAVQQFLDAVIRAAVGGHKATKLLGYKGFYRDVV
jgi:hypothetical protein